jgi:hypothetical protein
MANEVVFTRTEKIWLAEDGIIRCIVLPTPKHKLEDAKENVAVISKLAGQKKRPVLVDARQVKSIERESRAYYAGQECAKVQSAVAFLISSYISKIIGNFFLGFNKPLFPINIFTSQAEAIEWLKGFRR